MTVKQIRKIDEILQHESLEDRVPMRTAGNGGKSESFKLDN